MMCTNLALTSHEHLCRFGLDGQHIPHVHCFVYKRKIEDMVRQHITWSYQRGSSCLVNRFTYQSGTQLSPRAFFDPPRRRSSHRLTQLRAFDLLTDRLLFGLLLYPLLLLSKSSISKSRSQKLRSSSSSYSSKLNASSIVAIAAPTYICSTRCTKELEGCSVLYTIVHYVVDIKTYCNIFLQ